MLMHGLDQIFNLPDRAHVDVLYAYHAAAAELQRVIEVSQSSNAKIDEAAFLVQRIESPKEGERIEDLWKEHSPRSESCRGSPSPSCRRNT